MEPAHILQLYLELQRRLQLVFYENLTGNFIFRNLWSSVPTENLHVQRELSVKFILHANH